MTKPINENIRDVRIEDDEGILRPVLDVAGERLSELIGAIVTNNKAGSLTMKIDIKPSTAGALAVKADVKITKPKGLPPESLLWPTPENNLLSEDPRQHKLPLAPVASAPKDLPVATPANVKTA